MDYTTNVKGMRDEHGNLPAWAWPGGYQMLYWTKDGADICPDCANSEDFHENHEDDQFRLVAGGIYWKGPTVWCAHCNGEVESCYGDPDEQDVNEDNDGFED